MKVRWWPFISSPRVASTRIRCLHVMEGLRQAGLDARLFDGSGDAADVLILSKRYDEVSLKTARKLQAAGTRVVLDLCDNHFYSVNNDKTAIDRAAQLRSAIAKVDAVIVSTPALAEIVRAECPNLKKLYVIGDAFEQPFSAGWRDRLAHPLDELNYMRFRKDLAAQSGAETARLLWFGNHGSPHVAGGMEDLRSVATAFNALPGPVSLTVISNNREKFERMKQDFRIPCIYLPWSRSTFSRAARLHDIAVIPVRLDPFSRCKTNNRVATALIHGLAVAADPVPSYLEFGDSAVIGDWSEGLAGLCGSLPMRQQFVEAGKRHLQKSWSLGAVSLCWQRTLESIVS